jgi:hypothetical protein
MVVERHAGAHDVDERRAAVLDRRLDQRHELLLVAGEAAGDERRAQHQRELDEVDRLVAVDRAALRLGALVGGGRELALGEPVDAVVLDDVDHVDAAAHRVRELADADRRRIAVAGDAEVDEIAVGERRAGQHRGHPAVDAVEAVRLAEEVRRRLRRAADPRQLGHPVRRDRQVVEGLDDRRRDGVVAAAGAQRRHRPFVVAPGEAELVLRQVGVMQLGLGQVGHGATLRRCFTLKSSAFSAISRVMKRAVSGLPS